jgi:hypothetical protein
VMNWAVLRSFMQKSRSKYPFYEGNFSYADFESSTIARRLSKPRVGWGKRAIEMRSNKTHFDRFENDTIGLNEVFDEYHGREALNKIKEDILVCGVGFLAVAGDRVMPFTALEATGTYDWHEQNLENGVAVFREKTTGSAVSNDRSPDSFMSFTKDSTLINTSGIEETVINRTGRPLIGLFTHKSTTKQPFGRTVLVGPARDAMIDGSRTVRQAMIAAYHYNKKVDVLLGVDSETAVDKVETSTGDILKVGANENGQIPQIGQFAQHAMAPFNDSLLMSARNFCSDTKLNISNLGISVNAPQSPEALEIVGDDLRDDIAEWQKEIGNQLKYFAVTLYMIKHGLTQVDRNLQQKIDAITTAWLPIYRADVSKFGDGLNKIAQNAPAIVEQRSIWRNLGLTSNEIDNVIASAKANTTVK